MKPPRPAPDSDTVKALNFNARFNQGLDRLLVKLKVEEVPHIKRVITTVVGGTILLIGAALLFLPGPGVLVILGGMAILGTEYAWARRWLRKGKLVARKALSQTQRIFSHKEKAPTAQAIKTAGPSKPLDDGNTKLVR